MKVNKRGFTLIEILAVIVILAVLAVITIPIVMGIIEDTRKNRFLEDVKSIISAIEQYNSENDMKAIGSYVVKQKDVEYKGDENVSNKKVSFKGNFDGAGAAFLNKSGLIRLEIENDKWCVHGTNKEYLIDEGDCSQVGQDLLVTYSVDKTGWAPKKVVTIEYPEREDGLMYDYSLDGGKTWLDVRTGNVAKVEFTKPGTIIARVFDGIHYQTGSSFAVTQIDSTAPKDVAVVLTKKMSNRIEIVASGFDLESGIAKIEFSKDDGKTWINNGTDAEYQFTQLKSATYPIKVRMTNSAGLLSVSKTLNVTTTVIDVPTYKVDKTGWQTKKIVTITYPARQSNFTYQYSTDAGKTWKTVASPATTQTLTFTSNGTVIARVHDGTNYVTASSFAVTQVDSTGPTAVAAVSTQTTSSIAIKATCTDAQSGITKIEYSKDNGSSYVSGETNTTYTFTGLKTGTYNFKVRCTNGSGMTATSTAVSGSTNSIGTPTYAVDKTGWQAKKVVTITYPARQSNFTYQYSLDGGRSWTTVASPATTKQVTFTANGTIIARITDGTNYVTASSFSVTQIDTSAPSATVAVSSTTYNSATLKATCTDAQSGITKVEFSKDNGASYVANGTNTTYTFGSLATGTYNFRARCTNGVGLQTQSAAVSKLIQNQFTLTYNANGGSVSPTSKKVTAGSTYGTLPTPTKANYRFLGWFTAASGGTKVSSSTVMAASNVTIYAHWQATTTIVFKNDMTGATQSSTIDVGKTVAAPNYTATGYTRTGWGSSNTTIATVSGNTITAKSAGSATITTKWSLNAPTVSGQSTSWTYNARTLTPSCAGKAYRTMTYQYSTNGGRTWTTASSKAFTQNKTVQWRCYDNNGRYSAATTANVYADTSSPGTNWSQNSSTYAVTGTSKGCSSLGTHKIVYTGSYAWRNSWESGKAHYDNYFMYCNLGATGKFTSIKWSNNCQKAVFQPSLSAWKEWWGIQQTKCVHTGKTHTWQQK